LTRDLILGERLHGFDLAVVLGGGNALGAFHLGVCEGLLDGGAEPFWYVGASIGAVTAAILVGNPPRTRLDRLREFWRGREQPDAPWLNFLPSEVRARWSNAYGLASTLGGRPGLAAPRLPGLWSILPGMPPDRALQDLGPLRRTLERLIDFERLNAAPERLSVVASDLATGEEAWFDTREGGIGPDELLASASLLPLFPPVEIGGRTLADGGLRNNLPVERPFSEPLRRPLLCVASDLYGLGGVAPASLDRAVTRAQDLGFAAQARRGIEHLARERDLLGRLGPEDPPAILAHLAYDAPGHERSLKALDFSATALEERAGQGRRAVAALRDALSRAPTDRALAVVRLPTAPPPRAPGLGF
jgi:NTE family protein